MIWLVLIAVAAFALSSASNNDTAPALVTDDACQHVKTANPQAAYALAAEFAKRFKGPVTSLAELEDRMLQFLRHALPECSNALPVTLDGVPWSDLIAAKWAAFAGQLEGAGAGDDPIVALARGVPYVIAEIPEGVLEPGAPNPKPGGPIPKWTPPPKPDADGTWTPVDD